MKYRKRPVVIDAMQFTGIGKGRFKNLLQFCPILKTIYDGRKIAYLLIPTLEGSMKCNPNDWVIKGVQGEFYPCKPDIFKQTYEKVE